MSLDVPKSLFALASLGLVLFLAVTATRERSSPGPLSSAHATDLEGPGKCARCHGDGPDKMAGACVECHEPIGTQLAAGLGLHGTTEGVEQCGTCHSEHRGAELELVADRAFALLGTTREAFAHEHVQWDLVGRHEELACTECHARADAAQPPPEGRFLGLTQDCVSCHDDPHAGKFVASCGDCHGQERPFAELASFTHTEAFPLTGAHGASTCTDCHAADTAHALEVVAGPAPPASPRSCGDCHESSHSESFLVSTAQELGTTLEESCRTCHSPAPHGFERDGSRITAELHAAGGFAFTEPHAALECSACHESAGGYEQQIPRRAEDCAACHEDAHRGQFAQGSVALFRCIDCHAEDRFEPHRFDVASHARTSFALTGRHEEASCDACHREVIDGARTFTGTDDACAACHEDVHRGSFGSSPDCARCHGTESFELGSESGFDHARDTSFALTGAHAPLDCSACHADGAQRPGELLGEVGDPATCVGCHQSPHPRSFDAALLPGAAGCATCHETGSFAKVSPERFDHGRWTGFELDGAHARAECVTCHVPSSGARAPRLGSVADAFGEPADRCATCHEDAHAGAFDAAGLPRGVEGREDCARCHGTESFGGELAREFDHGLWTGFGLEGAHATVSCASCHPRFERADALGRHFMHATGRACTDCHVDPHLGQFRREGRTDCARCHSPSSSFAADLFDHARHSRFALDERHAALDCSACHLPWPVEDGPEVVRYKPLGVTCAECHGPGVGRRR